jgi:hypothetical protein
LVGTRIPRTIVAVCAQSKPVGLSKKPQNHVQAVSASSQLRMTPGGTEDLMLEWILISTG